MKFVWNINRLECRICLGDRKEAQQTVEVSFLPLCQTAHSQATFALTINKNYFDWDQNIKQIYNIN